MNKYKFYRFFFIFIFFFPFYLFANYTGTGQAYVFQDELQLAKNQAFYNAQKNLLEKALLEILSQSEWNDSQDIIKNSILKNPDNYIIKAEILVEKEERNSYFFQIKGDILIEQIIAEIFTAKIQHQKKKVFLLYSFFNNEPYFLDAPQVRYFFQQLNLELKEVFLATNPFLNRIWNRQWEHLKEAENYQLLEASDDKVKILEDTFKKQILQDLSSQGYSSVIFFHLAEPTTDLDKFVFKKKRTSF